jgi:hypothetical protein
VPHNRIPLPNYVHINPHEGRIPDEDGRVSHQPCGVAVLTVGVLQLTHFAHWTPAHSYAMILHPAITAGHRFLLGCLSPYLVGLKPKTGVMLNPSHSLACVTGRASPTIVFFLQVFLPRLSRHPVECFCCCMCSVAYAPALRLP